MASRAYGNVDNREYMEEECSLDTYCVNYVTLCNYRVRGYALGSCCCFLFLALPAWILFGFYATQNADARTCALVASDTSLVTSQQVYDWSHGDAWPFPKIKYSDVHKTCVCDDAASAFPVWLSPVDIITLQQANLVQSLPPNFATTYSNVYEPNSNIKVCLTQQQLIYLWGNDQNITENGLQCHNVPNDDGTQTGIFTGRDGVLFCTKAFFAENMQTATELATTTAGSLMNRTTAGGRLKVQTADSCALSSSTPKDKRFRELGDVMKDLIKMAAEVGLNTGIKSSIATGSIDLPAFLFPCLGCDFHLNCLATVDRDDLSDASTVLFVTYNVVTEFEFFFRRHKREERCEAELEDCATTCPSGQHREIKTVMTHRPRRLNCVQHCVRD